METYTLEEQKAHRKVWVADLRSGMYKQGYGQLIYLPGDVAEYEEEEASDQAKLCCLGVACDRVEARDIWGQDVDLNHLPQIREYYGLKHPSGRFQGSLDFVPEELRSDDDGYHYLTILNDGGGDGPMGDGLSFALIADVIEAEPEGLFYTEEDYK